MKRFFGVVLILFILYFGIQVLFKFTTKGFEVEYQIVDGDRQYQIKEIYTANTKGETNNYYLTLDDGTNHFDYQTYADFSKAERIITEIKTYHSDQYTCILPVFRGDRLLFDITCNVDGVMMYYHDLQGRDTGLDTFASTMNEVGYHVNDWIDHGTEESYNNSVTFYQDNLVDNHYLAYQNYSGLFTMNKETLKRLYDIELFDNDIYDMAISGLVGKYYVVADYNSDYDFNTFYMVDVTNNKRQTIQSNHSISFDAYVQGIVENSMYIFDPSTTTQYEVNIKSKSVVEVGNADTQIQYYDRGEWSKVSAYDAVGQKLYFNHYDVTNEFSGYDRVDKVGGTLSGYYYFYQREGSNYRVYRSNIMNKDVRTYLFTTSRIDQIKYVDDYVYYVNGDSVYYYHDSSGIRKLYTNNEFTFNNKISFVIYH